jgi:beta-galactosidase
MRIRTILIIILIIYCPYSFSQQTMRLITGWEFLKQDLGGAWETVRPVKAGNPEDFPSWDSVSLPHCINAYDAVDPDVNYYQGPAWYRKLLDIQNPYSNGRTLLHFEGAGQKTDVYIYTTKVSSHVGGYDEWTVDITAAIDSFKKKDVFQKQFNGKIPLSIRTDNSRDPEMIPSNLADFNLYGGIYRYLNLVYVPAVSIDKIFAHAEVDSPGKQGKVTIRTRFYNPLHTDVTSVSVKLIDPQGKILSIAERTLITNDLRTDVGYGDFMVRSPQLWSPDKPVLYTIEVILRINEVVSRYTEKIGFRHFDFKTKGPFFLNGKRLLIRGTQRHEDHAGLGSAMTEELMRQEMILMKEMGVNFIRLGHYQQSRIILNLCDSLGIMVWEEIPWCRGGLGGEKYKQQAKRMLTNMIEQHYNHPSVIIWGLGNENDWPGDFEEFDKEKIRSFMKELNDLAHQLDPSRKTAIRRCDFCKDVVDVYSPSIWMGWYRGFYTDYKQSTEEEFKKTDHFLHMEWGGDSHAGRHSENPDKALQQVKSISSGDTTGNALLFAVAAKSSKDGDWSESYICNLFDWHLKEQETMPWLTGTAQWIFKDYSTAIRPGNPVPCVNQKGLVERDFTKKEGYYVFQSYWTTKPMAHIYSHSWPIRWGSESEEKMIKVYSNCDEAELFVNDKSYGIKKRNSQDFPAAGLRWLVHFNKGLNKVNVIAKKGNVQVKDEISFQYQTETWSKPAKAILEKINEENGICTIQVKLLDEKNVQCLDAANWVRFGLIGDGKLLDDLGTPGGSRLVQLYNGRAIIRVGTQGGKNIASAKIDGVPTVFLNL